MMGGPGRGQTLPQPDPFMSSPYTRETRIPRNKVFEGGNSAMEEAQLRKIDPSSTSVSTHTNAKCLLTNSFKM
jgi:hypothetical protein